MRPECHESPERDNGPSSCLLDLPLLPIGTAGMSDILSLPGLCLKIEIASVKQKEKEKAVIHGKSSLCLGNKMFFFRVFLYMMRLVMHSKRDF